MTLQLSPFVLPQIRVGAVRITTINMEPHPERVAYVRGLREHLANLVKLVPTGQVDRASVTAFLDRAYLGPIVAAIDWDAADGPKLLPWEHADDFVSFTADRLGVMFLDGRLRDERDMVYIPTGEATPALAPVLAAIARGVEPDDLLAIAADAGIELDDDFVAMLVERGVVDEVAEPAARRSARFAATDGDGDRDRVTWLGQSALVFQSGSSTVWFDPLVPARIRYRADEVAGAFSDQLAAAVFMPPPYDPSCDQLTLGDLPPPDAVVVSREDVVVFDLGLLMCLPATTPIVVPAMRPDRPWQVDIAAVIERVLGPRRVIRLAHGESIAFGDVRITAIPYAGEYPPALPTDWNCHVVHGRHGAVVMTHHAAVPPAHADRIAEVLGDRGDRAVMFSFDLRAGDRPTPGFREAADILVPANRQWPWYVAPDQLFAPTPAQGISAESLSRLGTHTGLRRFVPYGGGCAPWLTFQVPHVHRYYIKNLMRRSLDRIAALARDIGFEVPPIQIGVPFAL